jgi:NADH dehydrogenase FAD-containing subunit
MTKEKKLKEFDFILAESIEIHKHGQKVDAAKVLLKCPSSKHQRDRLIIKNGFMNNDKAQDGGNQNAKKDDDFNELKESEKILGMLYSMKKADQMGEILDAFKRLLVNGCGIVEGIALTETYIDEIDANDLDDMLGEYIVNFILPSWMKRLMNK